MVELHDLYVTMFAVTAGLALAVAWLAWRRRAEYNAPTLIAFMLGVTAWCGAESLLWWVPTPAQQKFWLAMTYPGVSVVVVAMLAFAFGIARMEAWLTPRRIALVSIAPAALCVIATTNPGGLFNSSFVAESVGPYTHYAQQPGPLFWVYLVIVYGMLVIAFVVVAVRIVALRAPGGFSVGPY